MVSVVKAKKAILDWVHQYRIIPSKYPPIPLFEGCVDPELLDELYAIESLTNERILEEVGALNLVRTEDRISGLGASVVMAAFTHTSVGRFSDGSFGAYYAANSLDTAFAETKYSRACFMGQTSEDPCEIDMRVYIGEILKPMLDIRGEDFNKMHHPTNLAISQAFAKQSVIDNTWGIVYRSVRHQSGECIAALRPPAISIPRQGPHFSYLWNGKEITHIIHKRVLG